MQNVQEYIGNISLLPMVRCDNRVHNEENLKFKLIFSHIVMKKCLYNFLTVQMQ